MDPFEARFGTAAPRAQIAWVNDFAPTPKDQTARWQGASSTPFGIPVSRATASGFEASLGVGGSIGSKITWSFDYAAVFGNNGRSDRMQGQVGITF